MDDCVFCKIAKHEIPSDIFYEDADTVAFLDIKPTTHGHSLVIPKKHFENIFDIDEAALEATMRTAKKVAPAVRDAVGAKGLHMNSNNGEAAGQIVFHYHVHLIPRHDRSEFQFWGHHDLPKDEAKTLLEKLRAALT